MGSGEKDSSQHIVRQVTRVKNRELTQIGCNHAIPGLAVQSITNRYILWEERHMFEKEGQKPSIVGPSEKHQSQKC